MGIEQATENPVVTGSDGGRSTANLVYILYIIGFFFALTALIGVILAYVNREKASKVFASHMNYQIKIFIRGLVLFVVGIAVYILSIGIGLASGGVGFILMIIPVGIALWWLVWTIMRIAKGMGALGRGEAITA